MTDPFLRIGNEVIAPAQIVCAHEDNGKLHVETANGKCSYFDGEEAKALWAWLCTNARVVMPKAKPEEPA